MLLRALALVNGGLLFYIVVCGLGLSGRPEANFHPAKRPAAGPGLVLGPHADLDSDLGLWEACQVEPHETRACKLQSIAARRYTSIKEVIGGQSDGHDEGHGRGRRLDRA